MPVVTWDSVNKGSGVTLSNGNLTATIPNLSNTARATISRNSGKWYWEIKLDSGSYTMIGIVNNIAGVGRTYDNVNAMYYYYDGKKWNGSGISYGSSYKTGDIISVLLDLDNGTIEFWKNGVSQGVAFTNVKSLGDVYPAVTSASSTAGGTLTANFGASPFVYKIPHGYYSYDGSKYGAINKILILSNTDNEIKTIDLSNSLVKSIPSQTEQDFINYGMDSLSSIDPKTNFIKKQYIRSQSTPLSSGKTFTQQIDLARYKVNKISFQ